MQRFLYAVLAISCLVWASAGTVKADPPNVQLNPQDRAVLASDPQGAMQSARERVAAGDLDGAIGELARYVSGHPGEIGPERLLGDLYYRHGDMARAESTYNHILGYAPRDKETHNRLGSVYATENRIDAAIDEFNRSLPGTDSVQDLVLLHMRKGDFPRYREEREKAARDFPTDPEDQLELGEVYIGIHQPDLAMRYTRRAMDEDMNSNQAYIDLGREFMDLQDYANATDTFGACLRKWPNDYACSNNLGATYLESKQYGLAANILSIAHRLRPEAGEALVNLGYLDDVNGDWKGAVSYYVQAMTVYPYAPEAYINLGLDYVGHGFYELAQSALLKGLAVAPEDGRLHFVLGDAYLRQGNQTLAAAQFRIAANSFDPTVKDLAKERVASLERSVLRITP
ncbi:MAG TPA: tetratricopeptide repeat protein [Candidatus Rubrimentiphilum sp.]|nr:tetratricopeptide repeat protein [Candidatus Rubrimentiphilum sp.]